MVHFVNAFSLSMLGGHDCRLDARRLTLDEARALARSAESAIGHAGTAALLGALLGCDVAVHRRSIVLDATDEVLVAQYSGPRLPEGCTTLPEGAAIEWWSVRPVVEESRPPAPPRPQG